MKRSMFFLVLIIHDLYSKAISFIFILVLILYEYVFILLNLYDSIFIKSVTFYVCADSITLEPAKKSAIWYICDSSPCLTVPNGCFVLFIYTLSSTKPLCSKKDIFKLPFSNINLLSISCSLVSFFSFCFIVFLSIFIFDSKNFIAFFHFLLSIPGIMIYSKRG